jgi:hypothetical protein
MGCRGDTSGWNERLTGAKALSRAGSELWGELGHLDEVV